LLANLDAMIAIYIVDREDEVHYLRIHGSPRRLSLMPRPTPHLSKLEELSQNSKLPDSDRPRVEAALARYRGWIVEMEALKTTGEQKVVDLVAALNRYKRYVELELIWDSPNEFLYRQRAS